MVDYSGVKVEGARRLRTTLKKAGADMKQMRTTHRSIADIISRAAQSRVPQRSSRLSSTIRPGATQAAAIARAGNNRKGGVPYANPIHWGWHRRHIRPNPFLSLAAQDSEPKWFAAYSQAVEHIINQIQGV